MATKKEFESAKEWYLKSFDEYRGRLNGQSKTFFTKLREEAVARFAQIDFPTTKVEDWKYTSLSSLLKNSFTPASSDLKSGIDSTEIENRIFSGFDHHLLVFVNGIFNKELSNIGDLPAGVIVDSFNNILKNNPGLIEQHIKDFSQIQTAFDALNTAYASDGAVVIVPEAKVIEKPIQILYLNGDDQNQILNSPKNIIIAGKESQVRIISKFESISANSYFSNVSTEIFVGEKAIVDFYKIQNEKNNTYHIEKVEAHQGKESIFSHYNFSFGGGLVRNDIHTRMDDENIETNYFGLYLGNENQHIDNHTFIDHAKPNCVSNELYKGILDDKAHGVFNGKIMVRKDAQKTNAYQSNKGVLLSKSAKIDTKPELEIYADDVKCSHGATVGHLDDTAYFYIRSRGVPADLAKSMLIRAFANDVVEKIKIVELKEQINHLIFEHLRRVEI